MSSEHLSRSVILRIASVADADPRSVVAELAAERGERPHVRGERGKRIRAALLEAGLIGSERKAA